jgi:KaiC/GvpD/RAD55 family RecA-like ATPase
VVEVSIEEMFGSDRNRPKDYGRAVVIDAGPKNTTNEDALPSEGRSALKNTLTEPTLLEMSG